MKKISIVFIVFLLMLVGFDSAAQCAMCKSSIESNQKEQVFRAKARAEGLNTGILYLMVLPYIMFGVIGYFWYKNSKSEREAKNNIESMISNAVNK
ncbi:MAG: hypothetical protein ACKVOU_04400 [Cytophagales bacterium]